MKYNLFLKIVLLVGLLALSITLVLLFSLSSNTNVNKQKSVVISEIIPANKSLLADKYGNYFDLVELYNTSSTAVDITGYGLSDNIENPRRWVFPETTIQPKEYLIIYLSKTGFESNHGIYANFSLDKDGEVVVLTNADNEILQMVSFKAMKADMSISLIDGEYEYVIKGTPGQANDGEIISVIFDDDMNPIIKSSLPPGIYDKPLHLELKNYSKYDLRYTLDGKDPTALSQKYEKAIYLDYSINNPLNIANIKSSIYKQKILDSADIEKGTVVKAQYFDKDTPIGDMFIGTYFIWEEGLNKYSFDVISLITDTANLFDPYKGIYVIGDYYERIAPAEIDGGTPANYNQRGDEWEKEAHIEFFNADGQPIFDQNIGIRIFGAWSRAYAKKSFKLIPRKIYDQTGSIDFPFFEGLMDYNGKPIESFERLLLRSGGQDWGNTLFTDPLVDSLVSDILDHQAYKPVILFLNGEYWGIYHLREHLDQNYLESHFNVNAYKTAIIENGGEGPALYYGENEDLTHYLDFINFVNETDLSVDKNFDTVKNMIDLKSFINYYCTQMFINNSDWPGNNLKIWRYTGEQIADNEYTDGKYRYLLYDTEFSFGLFFGIEDTYNVNSFDVVSTQDSYEWPNPWWSNILYKNLMENKAFKEEFLTTLADYLNSRFSADAINKKVLEFKEIYKPEMEEYIDRYYFFDVPNIDAWEYNEVARLIQFAEKRNEYMFVSAKEYYNIGEYFTLSVNAFNNGTLNVNNRYIISFNDETKNKELTYFSDFLIEIEAKPEEGYQFDGWIINEKESGAKIIEPGNTESRNGTYIIRNNILYIRPDGNIIMKPIFKED